VSISFEDLEGAKREITAILPEEVSLVDIPAIKEQFAVIKNADGEVAAEVATEETVTEEVQEVAEVGKEAAEAPAIVALLKDFEDGFGARISELEKAIADLRKASDEEVVATDEAAGSEAAEVVATEPAAEEAEVAKSDLNLNQLVEAVSKTIISDLEARGVIATEPNELEEARKALDESVGTLKEESKTAFEAVAKAINGLSGRVESIETQDAGSVQADKPIQKSNTGGNEAGFFSSMLLNGLGGRQ
jgi:hypothetical protein